jgi:AcrR family transcriptional regulator
MDTKTQILDAAERLFAEKGCEASSLRAITSEAGVNLAAINYHFRSKESLVRAVLTRRLGPMNAKRMALLDECEREAENGPVPLESLVRAFILPVLFIDQEAGHQGPTYGKLIGRMFADPSDSVRQMCAEQVKVEASRFKEAFGRALPHLPPEELPWRLFFSIGIVLHMLQAAPMLEAISGKAIDLQDTTGMANRIVNFIVAGMHAPLRQTHSARGRRHSRPGSHYRYRIKGLAVKVHSTS